MLVTFPRPSLCWDQTGSFNTTGVHWSFFSQTVPDDSLGWRDRAGWTEVVMFNVGWRQDKAVGRRLIIAACVSPFIMWQPMQSAEQCSAVNYQYSGFTHIKSLKSWQGLLLMDQTQSFPPGSGKPSTLHFPHPVLYININCFKIQYDKWTAFM